MRLGGKVAIVTGATSGIGLARLVNAKLATNNIEKKKSGIPNTAIDRRPRITHFKPKPIQNLK